MAKIGHGYLWSQYSFIVISWKVKGLLQVSTRKLAFAHSNLLAMTH